MIQLKCDVCKEYQEDIRNISICPFCDLNFICYNCIARLFCGMAVCPQCNTPLIDAIDRTFEKYFFTYLKDYIYSLDLQMQSLQKKIKEKEATNE